MLDVEAFIASILIHSDPDYDPKKAHEYYLRTRILQGKMDRKKSGTKGTGSRSSTNTAARAKQTSQRRAALKGAASSREQAVAQLRATGERRGNEIRAKLEAALKLISTHHELANKELTKKTDAKIANLPDMPNGLTRAQQAEWFEKRRKDIDKILGDAGLARSGISRKTQATSKQARQTAVAAKKKMADDMRASIDKARSDYQRKADSIRNS